MSLSKPSRRKSSAARAGALCIAGLLLGAAPSEPAARKESARFPLTVQVHGIRGSKGRVAVALFGPGSGFPDQAHALRGALTAIAAGRAGVVFGDLLPGVYAVAVLHDENENSKMDFNFLGMPLEGYGFSNDASGFLGAPSFEAAAFELKPRASRISIKMRYFP